MMASVSMSGCTTLSAHKTNSGNTKNNNKYMKLEFYCTRCHVMCSISDLLYGDHVNHSAIREKEIVTYAPASLLHDTQLFAENVENNFIKPYILQETEMTQSLHMLLKLEQKTECAIRELTQQLHTIQKSLYALCQNKLLHECNTCTLQQEYLREWQGLNDAKIKLEHILLHKTENQADVTSGDLYQSNSGEGDCIDARYEETKEHKTSNCTHSVECNSNNKNNRENSSGDASYENVLLSAEVSEKLSGMNASQQLEHVSYILQSVKETLTCLSRCDNDNNYTHTTDDDDNYNNNLWREWLESMLAEETTLPKREKEEEHEKEKRPTQEVVQPINKNNSLMNRKYRIEREKKSKADVQDDNYQQSENKETKENNKHLSTVESVTSKKLFAELSLSTPPYSLLQHATIKETHTEVPLSAAIANEAHSPTNGVSSVQISRGIACSSISEHDSTQSCEWITAEPPQSSASSSSLHRTVEGHRVESTEFDASFRNKCALSIAEHLEHEVNKRISANAMNDVQYGSTYKTTGNVMTKEVVEPVMKPVAPLESKINTKRLNDTYENVKRQEVELQEALEELKCMHDTSNCDSIVQSDSDTSSLIELQYLLIDKQQKKQELHQQQHQHE